MAVYRVLRTAKATLSRTFYLDEVATPATGPVVVSITRPDGTVVQSGNASDLGDGAYSYDFAGRDVVDELTVSWSLTIGGDAVVLDQDRIEVVGGFFFGLSEGRAVDKVLADTTKFPTADLIERRTETEDECERITGQAWVPRFCRETVSGDGSGVLRLSWPLIRSVRAVVVGGVAYAAPVVAALGASDLGLLHRAAGWPAGHRNIVVEYEHGNDRPTSEIVRASKLRFKSLALEGRSALPDRAERVVTVDQAGGSIVYGQPTAEKTGIPAVDAVYARYPSPVPGFG